MESLKIKIEYQIQVIYKQTGHIDYPEDTFKLKFPVQDAKSLLEAFKTCYKTSGRNFNDYPFNSLFCPKDVTFIKRAFIRLEGGVFWKEGQDYIEPPEYYVEACELFYRYVNYIQERLPKLRYIRDIRVKEEKERQKLKELLTKYGE